MNHPTSGEDTSRTVIPLFPLGTVLFPGAILPLHVFEPRYRLLVRQLMEPDAAPEFGVVAIRQGVEVGPDGATALHDIGCMALLRQVTPYEDGQFDIVTVGRRRFRLLDVESGAEPYLRGTVEWLPERPVEPGEADVVARSVAELFARCGQLLQRHGSADAHVDAAARAELPADPVLLSLLVATAGPFTLDDRQSLLAARDTTERLRLELRLLKQEVTMLSRLRAVPVPLAQLRVPMGVN